MKFNANIYNEIDSFDAAEFLECEENWDIYRALQYREEDLDPATASDADLEYAEEIDLCKINRIDFDSLLLDGLCLWYQCDRMDVVNYVRSGVLVKNYNGTGKWYVFYVSGIGYDTISSDLLGNEADGVARDMFIDILNVDHVE